LNAPRPAMDWASQLNAKITPITSPRDREYRARGNPPVRAHVGEFSSACSPTFCSWSDSCPCLLRGLDSGDPYCRSQTVA
jgi:thiamine biosynthesis protein ThiC